VDAEADLRRMAAAGVDGIITDDPLFAREVVKQI
jgi:glycerophosphoryl diester phosphodiesterase